MKQADLITPATAARLLGVAENSVRQLERRGELHATRAGAIRLFDRRAVEEVARIRHARRTSTKGNEAA